MKVLVTRAKAEAQRLADRLAAQNIDAVIEPLTTIRFLPQAAQSIAPFLTGVQAVLFTSANGARAFAAASSRRDLKVFAVGDATAAAARDAGFDQIASAGGNVEDLAALVIGSLKPSGGALIHAAGSVTAGDLAGLVSAAGFVLRRAVLYEAVPTERLSNATCTALAHGDIAAALFFSPRNAATFVRLAAAMRGHCTRIIAAALSPAVAQALKALPWQRIVTAASPNEAALLQVLEQSLETERLA
jgi:uroporphyrinogen-III synthase